MKTVIAAYTVLNFNGKNWVRLTLSGFWAKFLYYTGHKKTVWSQKLSEIKVYCHVARGSFHPSMAQRRSEWPMRCEESWVWPITVQDAHISRRRMDCLDYHLWWVQEAGEGVAWFRQKHPPRSWPGRVCSHWQGNKERGNKIWGLMSDLGGATIT